MSSLDAIKVSVEGLPGQPANTRNALPVLHEIRHALAQLDQSGEPTVIDLSAIPFAPGDRDQLLEFLGKGEVSASIDAMGESLVYETAFPGVWLIQHKSPQGDPLSTHIEITRMPSVLATPEEDVREAQAALSARLAEDAHNTPD